MENREYEQPILVSKSGETLHVAYDGVSVDFPPDGSVPEGAPPLACRIFEVFRCDLQADLRAE